MRAEIVGGIALVASGLLFSACSRKPAEAPVAATPNNAERTQQAEGAPQIANSADGVHIQYRLYGQGEPAIVLVHGWSCDSNYWSAQLEELRKKYTVLTVDLAGHGGSDRNRAEWSMGRFGDDVAAAVNKIANPKVIIVGHSMGGPVAIEAAKRLPGRVLGVIGVDTYKSIGAPPPPADQLDARMKLFEADFIGVTREFVSTSFFTRKADPQFVRKVADDMSSAPPAVGLASIRALNAWDAAATAQGFTLPLIAINSDLGVPTDDASIQRVFPTFRSVTMPGTGHFLMMEEPVAFNTVLEEQIQALVAPPSAS
jgi:pimeloyl-ACP methyl ester carboxylesterase